MEFHLAVTNYVGSISTLVNGLFIILIVLSPPDNLGIFRSQYYAGAITSFLFAATQLWSAEVFYPNGTLFVIFSARRAGTIGFLAFLGAHHLQFMMLTSNFVARYAAIRGGWMQRHFTSRIRFYGLLAVAEMATRTLHDTYFDKLKVNFVSDYVSACSYDQPPYGSMFLQCFVYLSAVGFQGANLVIMLICGVATYVHISKYTLSRKLKEVNNRQLFARSFQATFSFLFLFIPGLLINTSMLLRIDASRIAFAVSSLMSIGTLFNPFVDIVMTTDYRKRILNTLFPTKPIMYSDPMCGVSTSQRRSSARSLIVHVI